MSSKKVFTLESPHGPGGIFFCWQKSSGNFLVTTGYNQTINIYSRQGEPKDRLTLQGLCSGFGWDKDGDLLAVINDNTPLLLLWDSRSFKTTTIDTGLHDQHAFLIWSKTAPLLAVGTAKGNLVIYNSKTSRKIPVIGKHAKRIMCGAWSKQNLLALGGEDRSLTVSNAEGDTIRQTQLRGDPSDIQFSTMKSDERRGGENTVSLIISRKTLFLFNLDDPENPIELAFQSRYGSVVAYEWFGDGYVLIGFSQGYFVAISTHLKEIGQELFQARNHRDALTDIAVNPVLGRAASCGDNQIKIHELADLREVSEVVSLDEERAVDGVAWSDDGQLLAVSTPRGNIHVYLSKLPMLGEALGAQAVFLTGLDTVTVKRIDGEAGAEWTRRLDVEPAFLGIGLMHYAAGMNNRVWFYALGPPDNSGGPPGAKRFVKDKEYSGNVQSLKMNETYASVLHDGKALLHLLEADAGENEEREMKLFPGREQQIETAITDHALTQDFFIYTTDFGGLFYFGLEDWNIVADYKHRVGIRKIFPEITGSRVIFIDDKSEAFIYSAVNDEVILVPSTPPKASAVLWENWLPDRNVFVVLDDTWIYTYIYRRETINGPSVEQVGKTRLPLNQRPLILVNGELTCQTPGGKLTTLTLATHEMVASVHDLKAEELQLALEKNLALGRFKDAWQVCLALDRREDWINLGETAMKNLDVELAARAYRQAGDVGMVWFLEDLAGCQDRILMAGHVAMALNEYDKAQEWYLRSGSPVCALEMRRDLLHWDQALQLANKLAPGQIPAISREYAQQLEFTGDYPQALVHYEKAIGSDSAVPAASEDNADDHKFTCRAGIARTSLRCGDIRKGVQIAAVLDSKAVKKDCAEILESMKQYSEAASLYEKGQFYDKAAVLYIRLKNWPRVAELLPNVTSPRIHLQFAKAKETEGRYKEALVAYERARDYDSVVRLLLDHLEDPEGAVRVVKETKSVEGARMVAKFFQKLNDFPSAIQFLVLSKCNDEAFRMAQQHSKMELYADIIGEDATHEDYSSIAMHFESSKNLYLAGKFFFLAGKHEKAMGYLLKHATGTGRGDDTNALQLAVDVAASSEDEKLTGQLIDFLLGDVDGVPKDARFLFRLYMAKKMFRQAAKTAVIIAGEEQSRGNYRVAHDVLLGMCGELRSQNLPVGHEMINALGLLHSYVLVRVHVKRGEHKIAARLLCRVARSISKFPAHVVPILTSTVIECQRSGMKSAAFSYAAILMRPEHRPKIDDKYKSKIEAIVRKNAASRNKDGEGNSVGPNGEDEEMGVKTPCPACAFPDLPEMDLDCPRCKTRLPFCLATGRHIVVTDLTKCPGCLFPAIRTEFVKLLTGENPEPCPMCGQKVASEQLELLSNAKEFLERTKPE